MKFVQFDDPWKRKCAVENDEIYNIENHRIFLDKLIHNIDFSYNKIIMKELKQKHASYKSQDKKNNKYDQEQHISYSQLLNKLQSSQLTCFYCKDNLLLMYRNKNEKKQWSLERLNNNLGHYDTNTCIACLQCNLQRRNENYEYFQKAKQWKIFKNDS
jgi:hypothetical protein